MLCPLQLLCRTPSTEKYTPFCIDQEVPLIRRGEWDLLMHVAFEANSRICALSGQP